LKRLFPFLRLPFLAALLAPASFAAAQDVVFTHLLSAPMYVNPAFAGAFGGYHAGAAVRSPFTAVYTGTTVYAEGAAFLPSWRSGIGVSVMNDRMAGGAFQTTSFGLAYTYAFRLSETLEVRPALQAVCRLQQRSPQAFTFPDRVGVGGANYFPYEPGSNSRVDFAAGILFAHPAFSAGAAVHHIGAAGDDAPWVYGAPALKITAHAALPLALAGGSREVLPLPEWTAFEHIVLTPQAQYVRQADFQYLMAGATLRSGGLFAGAAVRTSLRYATYFGTLSAGLESRSLKIGYGFDFLATGGDLRGWNSGSHELFVHYSFGAPDDPSPRRHRPSRRGRALNPACGCPY
jgi:type IX secretion system PorP/SprF family membrane protein